MGGTFGAGEEGLKCLKRRGGRRDWVLRESGVKVIRLMGESGMKGRKDERRETCQLLYT